MKTILRATLFLAVTGLAAAQAPAPAAVPATPAAVAPAAPSADLVALDHFLSLSDDELAQMADAITRVRAMTPAQRTALRSQIAEYRQLPEPQRMQIRQGWGWMPPEIQNGWREMMQNASPEERAAIQGKMQSLPPAEKMKYRRDIVEAYLRAKAAKK